MNHGVRRRWLPLGAVLAALALAGIAPPPAHAGDELPDVGDKVQGFELQEGFFRVYQKKHDLLLEVPRARIGQPFLLTTTIAGGSRLAGMQWTDMLVSWERLDDKLLLLEKNVHYRAKKGDPLERVVERTYTDRVVKGLPIMAEARSGSPRRGVLVDLNRLCAVGAGEFFGSVAGALDPSLARVEKLKVFPRNLELALTMPSRKDGTLVTLYYSLVALPGNGFELREADPRIGYFVTAAKDFTKPGAGDRFVRHINRWRLAKKDPGLELSPPEQPIVFYIERTVPIRYRRWVREGILEWNKAFERIGFYGAIDVRQQTESEFADIDPEDARYSFFRWITSDAGYAMGASRVNPLTGEIFDADIILDDAMVRGYLREYETLLKETPGAFFSPRERALFAEDPFWHPLHGTRLEPSAEELELQARADAGADSLSEELLRDQASRAAHMAHEMGRAQLALALAEAEVGGVLPEEFVGRILKEIVMHEVGHTLGLRHNFVASTWKSLEDIAQAGPDEATVASVMDYNPVFVDVPPAEGEEKQEQRSYMTGAIGPYDYLAIAYGYKPVKEAKELEAIAARISEPGFDYATDQDVATGDPYVVRWDIGDDPLAFANHRIDFAQAMLPKLKDRLIADGEDYTRLRKAVDSLVYDIHFAAQVAARFVGGERYHRDLKGEGARPPIQVIPAERQRAAVKLIIERVLAPGAIELDPELVTLLGSNRWWHWGTRPEDAAYPLHDRIYSVQRSALSALVSPDRLERIYEHRRKLPPGGDAYTLAEHFRALTAGLFSELGALGSEGGGEAPAAPLIEETRRSLQRLWVDALIRLAVKDKELGPRITRALAFSELESLEGRLRAAVAMVGATDAESAAHIRALQRRVSKALEADFVQ